jgi:hypothetical protein
MSIDILISIISALLSMLGLGIFNSLSEKFVKQVFERGKPKETYSQKLERLSDSLIKSSSEVDNLLSELSQVALEREKAVRNLETELRELETREKQLKERVQVLENIPLPVAEHFANLTAAGEKRSAKRDYMLFGAGVLVSTIIAIILNLTGLG